MNNKWVTVWGNTMSCDEFHPASYTKNITLRYFIMPLISGAKVKLRFANTYGTESVKLTNVTLSCFHNGECADFVDVTFNGVTEAIVNSGDYLLSDEIDFSVLRGNKFAVSIYIEGLTDLHSSISTSGPFSEYYFACGDHSKSATLPLAESESISKVYFLDEVEVLGTVADKVGVCFGDSITAQSWPEWEMLRLLDENIENIALVRKAISGNRVLREYKNLGLLKYGKTGIDRFENDISTSGADRVFILHGINDIIHPDGIKPFRPLSDYPTFEELIEGYREYIRIAHSKGLKIFIATILPFKGWRTYAEERNQLRLAVNEWIRTNNEADGCIDFDSAVRQINDPDALKNEYDSGDHLHPSTEGAKTMANFIPLELFK